MENTGYVLLSNQMATRRRMDVVANNIANMNTTGFQKEGMMFVDHVVRSKGGTRLLGDDVAYTRDVATWRDVARGGIASTGNPLDVAISGSGFLAIETANGERYTRNGRMQLDATGKLVNQMGEAILSEAGVPFFFSPEDTEITVAGDGSISTENGLLGKLRIVEFPDQQALVPEGQALYNPLEDNQPFASVNPGIVQGALEGSNVKAILEITEMMKITKHYQSVNNFVQKEDERIKTMVSQLLRDS